MMSSTTQRMHGMRRRSAFTIIELLVATAVTAVLAGVLLTMTNGVLRAWNNTSGSLSANAEAQLIFGLLTEDLQSALYRNDGAIWLAAEILEDSGDISDRGWAIPNNVVDIKPDNNLSNDRELEKLADCRYGLGGTWLRFFTVDDDGLPQAVAYQLVRRYITGDPEESTNPAEQRYLFYRSSMSAGDTFSRTYNLDRTLVHQTSGRGYNDEDNPLKLPPQTHVIGSNVIDFGVRFYTRDASGLEPQFPYGGSSWINNEIEYYATSDLTISDSGPFPDVVDVMVRILSAEGAKQIANLEAGRIPYDGNFEDAWWEVAENNSRVFTQRIYLNTKPF